MKYKSQAIILPAEVIEKKIFIIRGRKVLLSYHLAELYGIETRVMIQAVKRNTERFPDDFMFELTRDEIKRISQIVTSLKFSKAVYAFTEEGVAMLSSVLNSPSAIQMNIAIMRAFVRLREVLSSHNELAAKLKELEDHVEKHDEHIHTLFDAIRQLMEPPKKPKRQIGFRVEETRSQYKTKR
ncbi:MAG: ORF6N domain-containing protein [Bacteroidetes bacterium]|nr:ORF6N domain-containing protein [Bacteroidota bacterium]